MITRLWFRASLAVAFFGSGVVPGTAFLPEAFAVDPIISARTLFFNPKDPSRMGIEVEFKGVTAEQAASILRKKFGGKILTEMVTQKTTLKTTLSDGTKVYNEVTFPEYIVETPDVGRIVLKTDLNQVSDSGKIDLKKAVVELVSEPLQYPKVVELQGGLTALKAHGATGTDARTPVSIQVNLEIGGGVRENIKAEEAVNLMRSYLKPEHWDMIHDRLKVPAVRVPYLRKYSDGFLKKLLDPKYDPDWKQLFDDFVYRQSLERLKVRGAWTMPIEKARSLLLAQPNPIVPEVVKLNPVRVSSLLMFMNPDDPMTRLYKESGWAYARPLIEFREWNNDFNIINPAREAIGLKEAAKNYGYYDHDRLVYSITGIDEESLAEIRESLKYYEKDRPTIFRYFLGDPKRVDVREYENMYRHYGYHASDVGYLPATTYGKAPLRIPGESVVFHRRPFHRYNIMGKYNPGLINFNIQQALENKMAEAKFFEEFAPGSIPETRSLSDIIKKGEDIEIVAAKLKNAFPNGWVMKGIWDLGSEKDIITDKTDIVKEVRTYQQGDFLAYKKQVEQKYSKYADATPEYLQAYLKDHPGYKGYRISEALLKNPDLSMVQNRVAIEREFRVEALGGRVLRKGSTVDRYLYMYKEQGRMSEYKAPSKALIKRVEDWAQHVLDQLPSELRGMPMGMDVALLESPPGARGPRQWKFTLIESNPGGNSGFLFEEEKESVKALGEWLKKYPELVKSRKVDTGLSPESQMDFLEKHFKKWGITPERHYPNMVFTKDRIIDPEFKQLQVDPDYAIVQARRKARCAASVTEEIKTVIGN